MTSSTGTGAPLRPLRIGIDASNLRHGGGITHLIELLRVADPRAHGFSDVVVWAVPKTLDQIEGRSWLIKSPQGLLSGGTLSRLLWQQTKLTALVRSSGCDVLFVPGGAYAGNFHPVVGMCRNMLPFEHAEIRRYGFSPIGLKLRLLGKTQARTFRRADGVIFLTEYAKREVLRTVRVPGRTAMIPHGVNARFRFAPREQRSIGGYSIAAPFRVLYVSTVDMYKHQWHVATAIAGLRATGLPLTLDLVGSAYPPALQHLRRTLAELDPDGAFLSYSGPAPYGTLEDRLERADLAVFASSCENMPNTLLEMMAAGLPIVCSNRGPMPEILGDGGVYCDPESPSEMAAAIRSFVESPEARARCAASAFAQATQYTWTRCASATLAFIRSVAEAPSAT